MRNVLVAFLLSSACPVAQAQEMTPAAYEAALRSEVEILQQGVAQRKPGEAEPPA